MLSKRARPYDRDAVPKGGKLLANIKDLWASNEVSAKRAQTMVNDAHDDGLASLRHQVRDEASKNISRTLRRAFLKHSQWPKDYWAQIRCRDQKTGGEKLEWVAFSLPSELLGMISRLGVKETVMSTENMDPKTLEHLRAMQAASGCSMQDMGGLGLHGDGVPCNYDRTESAEVLSVNCPGVGGKWKPMRLPVVVLPHSRMSEHTWDDLMGVISWDLTWAFYGERPGERHDHQPWLKSDSARRKAAAEGEKWPCRWCLCEVRGDWKFMSETFKFPYHNQRDYICWKCKCNRAGVTRACIAFVIPLYSASSVSDLSFP